MNDPWKYLAFIVAGVAAFVSADMTGPLIAESAGLKDWAGEYVAAGATGLVLGFLVDDMLPVYIEQVRNRGRSGGGIDDDMDMDNGDLGFE